MIRSGFEAADVRSWSLPKLLLWTELVDEANKHEALLQSLAVWEPAKVKIRPQALVDDNNPTRFSRAEFYGRAKAPNNN